MTNPTGLAILVSTPNAAHPEQCATPLIHAIAARALDIDVEIHFSGTAIRFLVAGVAKQLYPTPEKEKSIHDFLHDAAKAGVSLLACSMARESWVGKNETLIPECSGIVGATSFIVRALDPACRTLTF